MREKKGQTSRSRHTNISKVSKAESNNLTKPNYITPGIGQEKQRDSVGACFQNKNKTAACGVVGYHVTSVKQTGIGEEKHAGRNIQVSPHFTLRHLFRACSSRQVVTNSTRQSKEQNYYKTPQPPRQQSRETPSLSELKQLGHRTLQRSRESLPAHGIKGAKNTTAQSSVCTGNEARGGRERGRDIARRKNEERVTRGTVANWSSRRLVLCSTLVLY